MRMSEADEVAVKGVSRRAARMSRRSCDFTAAAERWASVELSHASNPRPRNTAASASSAACHPGGRACASKALVIQSASTLA